MLPGPLMMGIAFDNTCVLWQTLPCSESSGSCAFYDNAALSKNFIILTVCVKFVSFVAMVIANVLYRPPKLFADTEVKVNEDFDHDAEELRLAIEANGDNEKTNGTTSAWSAEEGSKTTKVEEKPNGAFAHDDDMEFESVQL